MAIASKNIGWVAGILEGEGSFYIHNQGKYPKIRISVGMTDPDILEKLQVLTGVGNINGPYITKGNYDLYQWNVTKQQDAAALLMMIYSFMGYRRQVKIKELLEIWKSWTYRNQRDCINGHLRTKDSYYID